jgi:hypothetical protein
MNGFPAFGAADNVGGPSGTVASLVSSGVNFIPGVGPLVSGLAGNLAGALAGMLGGGGTPFGTSEFDGLHSPLPPLEASSLKMGEVRIYKGYAEGLGISVEEVDLLMKLDAELSGHSAAYVMDAWRHEYVPLLDNARIYLRLYNKRNPSAPIREGVLGPLGAGGTVPLQVDSNASLMPPASAVPLNSFSGVSGDVLGTSFALGAAPAGPTTVPDWLKLLLNGAVTGAKDGVTTAVLNTPQGQAAKADGAKSWVKDNELILAAAGVGLVALAYKAFSKK